MSHFKDRHADNHKRGVFQIPALRHISQIGVASPACFKTKVICTF